MTTRKLIGIVGCLALVAVCASGCAVDDATDSEPEDEAVGQVDEALSTSVSAYGCTLTASKPGAYVKCGIRGYVNYQCTTSQTYGRRIVSYLTRNSTDLPETQKTYCIAAGATDSFGLSSTCKAGPYGASWYSKGAIQKFTGTTCSGSYTSSAIAQSVAFSY